MEAFVIGSGPNGLTAAITLARAGYKVVVLEAQPTIGGGARSGPLTPPGFTHDLGSAVHPMALASPAFATMPLKEHGLEWIHPPNPVAHPLENGRAVVAHVSVKSTAAQFGSDDAAYRRAVTPLTSRWPELVEDLLSPPRIPRHPLTLARFGLLRPWSSAISVARSTFAGAEARAFFAGHAAHSILPLDQAGSAAFGWMLALTSHTVGWPIPKGGSQKITGALASYLESLGGIVIANQEVRSLAELPRRALVMCDVSPRQLLRLAGGRLPDWYCRKLERYRYGAGVFKLDWALSAPIPWRNPACASAGTLHLGGTLEEIAISELGPSNGYVTARPFVLLAQPSLFDASRAPSGQHTAWAYCHVPNGSAEDMTARIEAQVERFAPGFGSVILARHASPPAVLESMNANLIGGDIVGGSADLGQLFLRPTSSLYRTPDPRLFLCSASTPPGGGVHGMCGHHAARAALR